MNAFVVVGTGHRPDIFGPRAETPILWVPVMELLESLLVSRLDELPPGTELKVVQGLGKGYDIALGAAALRAKRYRPQIKLVCMQPFEGDTKTFKHPTWVIWHAHMLKRADELYVVSGPNSFEYKERNQRMISYPAKHQLPGELWPCWNGKQGRGTSQTVNMARQAELPIRMDLELFQKVKRLLPA